jgi:DNA polymerase III subunit delta
MSFSVEKALKHRAILLGGDEEILVRRAIKEIVTIVAPEGDDFDMITLDADSATPEQWSGAAGTAPFLAERRTVIVRHLLRCDEPERLRIDLLPEYALVVLIADEESTDPRKLTTLRQKWEKHVNASGGHTAVFNMDGKTLPGQLRNEAKNLNNPLSPSAASMLAEMVGGSLSRGLDELEKLSMFVGPGEAITERTLRDVVVPSREWNIFRLVETVAAGDIGSSLRQLQILVGSSTKAEDAAHSQILPMLHRQLRLIWQARIVLDARATMDDIPASVRAMFPDKPSFAKEPPYRQSKLMALARNMSLPALARGMKLISDADARLKGMLPGFTAMETLESTILHLATALRAQAA